MEAEFIPYQEALALKELGFDEPCFVYWVFDGVEITFSTSHNKNGWSMIGFKNNQMTKKAGLCTAPTYQQVFRWFREKYKLHQYIKQYYGEKFYFHIEDMVFPRRYEEYPIEKIRNFGEQYSQEEAELECLRKLINIVKDGN